MAKITLAPKYEDKPKKINEATEMQTAKLLAPPENKPIHKLYGSTKHLFQKQVSMDLGEDSPFLLTVPSIKIADPKVPLPKHDSQESVQRIITERRKLDENLKGFSQYDIFDVKGDSQYNADSKEKKQSRSCEDNDKC